MIQWYNDSIIWFQYLGDTIIWWHKYEEINENYYLMLGDNNWMCKYHKTILWNYNHLRVRNDFNQNIFMIQ